mmetsp:Transcript_14315/g.23157  ORF Transcript_14315/g.23157 Transcript_14315/m.23157 type:complete len:303 (+) Transcript_14315:56-964(+)|eukprot:CAMPEP_0178794570 /NCGR_PEP_ID=MMETSP0745-20121128/9657_1 /TAXON_ID=913974 /ORGANISM="Nitzschia punctata, Strain CCMP561" /LENGTH=302 /DNA_ID=CAMNT_0020452893 /DNA_START=182 /DNA_END=1090 /DNA_ORIENTATION=-
MSNNGVTERAARSPRTGSAAAPVSLPGSATSAMASQRSSSTSSTGSSSLLIGQISSLTEGSGSSPRSSSSLVVRRRRSSGDQRQSHRPTMNGTTSTSTNLHLPGSPGGRSLPSSKNNGSTRSSLMDSASKAQSRSAQKLNDSMVYLDGPQIYTCAQCRTHLTTHDEIISKSFHGRHGRAYLFDHCVNVTIGPAEDRPLITGLHSVCDIFCKRCKNMVGWTYSKAYEASQKYKEGKFIVEKINLHLEESDYYDVAPPAGERKHSFRARSISWGSDCQRSETIYEYRPSSPVASLRSRSSSTSG